MIRALAVALCVLVPLAAQAQDDASLLAPLTPSKPKAKAHPKHDDLDVIAPLGKPAAGHATRLSVRAPKAAQVEVDGKSWGVAPVAEHAISPGTHELAVTRPGFAPYHRRFVVRRGKHLILSATLQPVSGVLAVRSEPPGADVSVDGEPVGKTPVTGRELKPGNYELRVHAPGFMEDVSRIAMRAGEETSVDRRLVPAPKVSQGPRVVSLAPRVTQTGPSAPEPVAAVAPVTTEAQAEPSTPWFKRWYVWAGAGAVVAAVAVGVAASSGTKIGGPPTPTSVCGGPCDGVLTP